ncbi:hypothetical protein HAX54_048528 [Datura stramonium]|uniref:Uncharacterized protein n=1 Tax=Datura stramonium TaxID=4076 RepID=A0ABS8SUH0_DATST|nr:hypothetical protein [Datura stramonium]
MGRRSEVRDRKVASIMELLQMLTRKVIETKVWSVNAIKTIEKLVHIEEEVYFLDINREVVAATYGCGYRMSRSGKPPCDWVEYDDGQDIDRYYGAMLFKESIEAMLLKYDGEGVEGFE